MYVHGDGPLHRLPPACKILGQVLFVLAVVATPREAGWAFLLDASIVVVVAWVAGLRAGFIAKRLVIEVPFLAFAIFLPIVGTGERVDVLGLSLSVAGLWAAWNIIIKGTIGVATAIVVAATTPVADMLRGLERLHLPRVCTLIASFMVRYVDVIAQEAHRMRIARISRCHDPRWIWQARAVAASAGALFIRSYERGERVHLAMLSRGSTGTMPVREGDRERPIQWVAGLVPALVASVVAAVAWGMRP